MVQIYKRGKILWGRVQRDGKEYRRSLKTTNKAVARKRASVWVDELEGIGFGERPGRTFDDLAEKFNVEHLPTLKPKSAKRYYDSLANLARTFEGLDLTQIRSPALSDFVTMRRGEGVTAPTIRRDLACLSSMFGLAIEWEWCEVNPVGGFLKRMKKRGLRESPSRTRYLTLAEEQRLIAECSASVAKAVKVAIDTGLRTEELFSLKWAQVDLDGKEIEITQTTSKNSKARRVPILPRAGTILGTLPRHFKLPYVFWHLDRQADGRLEAVRYRTMDKGFRAAANRANVHAVQFHDLRRTCGCRLLQGSNGRRLSLDEVRDWLGHSSVKVTEKAYAFLAVDQLHEAVGTKTGSGPADS